MVGTVDILVYNYLTKLFKNTTEPNAMSSQDSYFEISNRSLRSSHSFANIPTGIIRIAKTKNLA